MMRPAKAILLAGLLAACACAGGQTAPTSPAPEPGDPPAAEPSPPGEDCGGQTCAPPEQCVRYFGVAGPSVPLFACGVPCGAEGECPDGKQCQTIADGPRLCK